MENQNFQSIQAGPLKQPPKSLGLTLAISPTPTVVDLLSENIRGQMSRVEMIYIDNADNDKAVYSAMDATAQRIICPPNSQGYFFLLLPNAPKLAFYCENEVEIDIQLLNFRMPPVVWSVLPSGGGGGVGTVTSVGLIAPVQFTVTGSPVTTAGDLTFDWNTENANLVLAGPTNGAAAKPTFRPLVAADIPALPYGTGTVTSVGLTAPNIFNVGGSPIVGAGTLALTLANQGANTFWAGPTAGGAVAPTFRALVAADIPSLSTLYVPLAGGTMTGPLVMNNTDIEPDQIKGIKGTTTNNNAQAGAIGEDIAITVAKAAAVALVSNTPKTIMLLNLGAGDWEISAGVQFTGNVATTVANVTSAISSVNNAVTIFDFTGIAQYGGQTGGSGTLFANNDFTQILGSTRVSLAAPASVFIVAAAIFGTSTMSAYGTAHARRAR